MEGGTMGTLTVCPRRRRAEALFPLLTDSTSLPIRRSEPRRERNGETFLQHPRAGCGLALAEFPVEDGLRVVAVILENGSVRTSNGSVQMANGSVQTANGPSAGGEWSSGTVSGPDWTLWWNRRAFHAASP
jgi:hypothetical protein